MSLRHALVLPGSVIALFFGASVFAGCGASGSSPVDDTDAGGPGDTSPDAGSRGPGKPAGSDGGGTLPGTDSGGGPKTDGATPGDGSTVSGLGTIFTIVMENHDYNEIVGSPDAPYFNSLIADYGLATSYQDSGTHPSLPNYLTMISGAAQYPGILDVEPTNTLAGFPKMAENLGTQLQAGNVPWRAYAEDMGTPCALASAGPYATKHVPFFYFKDMQTGTPGLCAKTNVDYAANFATDLAAGTYKYMWITPNLTNDGHDPVNGLGTATDPVASLKASDAWAKVEIAKIMASPAYTNGGVIFLTWDEGEGRGSPPNKDQVPMIIISTRIVSKGFKSNKPYTHKSYLATVEDILKLPRLGTVSSEATMMEFFK